MYCTSPARRYKPLSQQTLLPSQATARRSVSVVYEYEHTGIVTDIALTEMLPGLFNQLVTRVSRCGSAVYTVFFVTQ